MEEFQVEVMNNDSQSMQFNFVQGLLDSQKSFCSRQSSNQSYQFVLDNRILIQQINKAQEEAEYYHQQFLHMKAINQSIIDAIKRVFSCEVAHELEQAMKGGFNFMKKKANQSQSQQFSQDYQNLSNQHSKQLTQTIYEIMVNQRQKKQASRRKDYINSNINKSSSRLSSKKLQFSNSKNNSFFVLTPSKRSENSIYVSPKKISVSKSIRGPLSPLFVNINKNFQNSLKDTSQISTNRTNNPQSIATSLLCQVCHLCFSPNQFFKHIQTCSSNHQSQKSLQSMETLNDTQHLQNERASLNYTVMMKNLLQIRHQIQSQIEMLKTSKQKIDRATLRKKLEKDLQKVTKIISKKESELKNIACPQSASSIGRKKKSTLGKK